MTQTNLFAIAFLSLIVFLFVSCQERKTPLQVTYRVQIHCKHSHSVHIYYRDSLGRKAVFADTCWSKTVTLPPGEHAALTVFQFTGYTDLKTLPIPHCQHPDHLQPLMTIEIITKKKREIQDGREHLHLFME